MLKGVTTRLEEVQKRLQEILPPNAILCGQSLNNDLRAVKVRNCLPQETKYKESCTMFEAALLLFTLVVLFFLCHQMFHPYVIDTSVIYNLTGMRQMKSGLRKLAAHFLGWEFRQSHSNFVDGRSIMTRCPLSSVVLSGGRSSVQPKVMTPVKMPRPQWS